MTTTTTEPKAIALTYSGKLKLMLVYQAGIANVFNVSGFGLGRDTTVRKRIYQGDFRTAEKICYGAALAGAIVRTAACNMVGDIIGQTWTDDLDSQPFSEKFHVQAWN